MKQPSPFKQHGAVTLLTAVVLLIGITLIALLVAKTVLVETQITADNYRTSQASAAASAAMDQAVAYYKQDGLDHNDNGEPDFIVGAEPSAASCALPNTTEGKITLTAGAQTTLAQYYFDNRDDNACDDSPAAIRCDAKDGDADGDCFGVTSSPGGYGTNMTRALITAKGWSDDCTAVRTITQCVTPFNIFDGGEGPHQPFVSKAAVGAFGNAKIINRYNNSTIWTGGSFGTPDVAFGTYLRPSNTETADYTDAQLNEVNETLNTQIVSNRNTGVGIDIITSDATLASKTADQFFDMFFSQAKSEIKNSAANLTPSQLLTPSDSLNGKSGIIWVEGNAHISNTDIIGDFANNKPAVVIVNGDLDLTGGDIYGVLYVTGTIHISGNPVVRGTIIGESTAPSTGAGTLKMVYVPLGGGDVDNPPFMPGTGAVVAGSWKDW